MKEGWKAKGKGRGVGHSWYTSGMEASAGICNDIPPPWRWPPQASGGVCIPPPKEEAPAGKGWGVSLGPNAGRKSCRKGGRKYKKKVSEMNEDEKELEKKRRLKAVLARRTDAVTTFT